MMQQSLTADILSDCFSVILTAEAAFLTDCWGSFSDCWGSFSDWLLRQLLWLLRQLLRLLRQLFAERTADMVVRIIAVLTGHCCYFEPWWVFMPYSKHQFITSFRPTAAIIGYAIGLQRASADEVFHCAQMPGRLEPHSSDYFSPYNQSQCLHQHKWN